MIKTLNNNEVSFVLVTLSYWFFMLTDGALRMLVLLHFHLGSRINDIALLKNALQEASQN